MIFSLGNRLDSNKPLPNPPLFPKGRMGGVRLIEVKISLKINL